jgi:hypothetical protein
VDFAKPRCNRILHRLNRRPTIAAVAVNDNGSLFIGPKSRRIELFCLFVLEPRDRFCLWQVPLREGGFAASIVNLSTCINQSLRLGSALTVSAPSSVGGVSPVWAMATGVKLSTENTKAIARSVDMMNSIGAIGSDMSRYIAPA